MYFPLFLNISGAKFLIIGGGNVALSKAEAILEFSKNITLLSKEIAPQVKDVIGIDNAKFIINSYDKSYIDDHDIIIVATDNSVLNKQIASDAKALNKLVNIVDNPAESNFIFGANIVQGKVIISISSSAVSPVLARFIKQKIKNILPKNLNLLSEFLNKNKQLIRKRLPQIQARRLFYQNLLEGKILNEVKQYNIQKAQTLLTNSLDNLPDQKQGAIYFISAGPGDPELITVKAIKLLSRADVVLYDRLVAREILDYARRDAIKINVGKRKDFHLAKQEEINSLLYEYASQGKIVARLKGGDVAIFARLTEEIDAIKDLKVPYQIVPGITAASGAAAHMGIALTSRDANRSVRFLTIYKDDLVSDKYFKNLSKSDDTLVLYMSSHNFLAIANNLIKFGKNPDTSLAVIEQATTPYQKTYISTLENFQTDFASKNFISPSLIIIGDVVNWHQSHKWREENLSGEFFSNLKNN